jgi:outer membrane receptor protein involved in Fe transport
LNNDRVSIGAGNTFAGIDNLTKVSGRNVIKAGAEIRRIQMNQGKTASGTVSYASTEAFEVNEVNTAKYTQAQPINGLRKTTYFGYLQDEFKWKPELTLNLGARYSFFNIFYEVYGRPDPFDFNTCRPAGYCGVGASFGQPTYRDIDPRVALAWAPAWLGGKTVVRSGFGTYHQDGQLDGHISWRVAERA